VATSPTAHTLKLLRRHGYTAEPVERWLPRVNVRRDLFHVGDVLGVHPTRREILLVQATSLGNISTRITKAKSQPELSAWLRSGGLFEVWGWAKRGDEWHVKRVALTAADMTGVVIDAPVRRRRQAKQASLFEEQPA
jgi:hypothetical protein